jgi:DNA polymerase I-like protein with 3'-5' exonuclease and polymerase domains
MIYFVSRASEIFEENEVYKCISVEESLKILDTINIVGLDTETEGFDPYTKKLLSLQLGNRDFQVVIDTSAVDVTLYKEYLESDRTFLGWNLKFDLRFLYKHGIYPKRVYDGYLAEKLLWLGYPSGIHSLSLKTAGETYVGVELDKTTRGKIHYLGLNADVIQYGANDVKYLEDIIREQYKELQKKGLTNAIKVENKFVLPLAYMEHCGIKLDVDKWKAKMQNDEKEYNNTINALNEWVCKHYPKDTRFTRINLQGDLWEGFDTTPKCTINWASTKQVIPLFKELGFNLKTKDKATGQEKDSVDAKIIEPQKGLSSIAPIYLNYKAAAKVVGTYGQNFLDQINPVSGRIHTSYSQMGADTTRITSGGKDKSSKTEYVNLLNLPSDEVTRACFVAEEGNKWISIDYSGQETYLMASIANDEAIIKELTEGSGDIHSLTAYMAYPEIPRDMPISEIKDFSKKSHKNGGLDYRQEAKGIEFAINYGGDANTIHQNKGIPLEEAQKVYNNYMSGFQGLKKYQDFRRKDWFDKGYILLNPLTGHKAFIYDYEELLSEKRRMSEDGFWDYYREMKKNHPDCDTVQMVRHFFKRKAASEKQSINYPVQATGSMCLRYSMIYLWKYITMHNLQGIVKICVAPYDEINLEAPEEMAEKIAKVVYTCMVEAGKIFCTRCKLDADISRNKDGSLPDHWIH